MTECIQDQFEFQGLGSRRVVADFSGGNVTSDAGGLLLREVEQKRKWIEQAARCFTDYRNPGLIEHTVAELLGQQIYGVALGYEDLNDHDLLRVDPLLATLCEKTDPAGHNRRDRLAQHEIGDGRRDLFVDPAFVADQLLQIGRIHDLAVHERAVGFGINGGRRAGPSAGTGPATRGETRVSRQARSISCVAARAS